jgi:hypothetical protein
VEAPILTANESSGNGSGYLTFFRAKTVALKRGIYGTASMPAMLGYR